MSFEAASGVGPTFAFRGRSSALVLGAEGVQHPRSQRGGGSAFTRYADITHVAVTPQHLWLGTKRGAFAFARKAFVDSLAPERAIRALLEQIVARPDGGSQLARMNEIDARAAEPMPARATLGFAGLCLAIYALQMATGSPLLATSGLVYDAGYMSPALVLDGDVFRIVTANLLHAFPLHLAFNLLCLLAVGRMLERAIGSERVICVMAASALGAMLTTGWLRAEAVVGASGVVFGLAGGLVWVELRAAEALPAYWRFPRRAFLWICGALLLDGVLGFVLPLIAGEAHVGGFVAGMLSTALLTPRTLAPASPRLRRTSVTVLAGTAVALAAAALPLVHPDDFKVRHALRVAQLPDVSPEELNERAWMIAIAPKPTPEQLGAALILAERAVEETERHEAMILDTLAEVQFQLGHPELALAIIEEAIAREPHEGYYVEQRRRFLGERARDDRPEAPLPVRPRGREPESPSLDGTGVKV